MTGPDFGRLSDPVADDQALELTRIANTLKNAASVIERVSKNEQATEWRKDIRIALSHATQGQYMLVRWLCDQEEVERITALAKASWSKP